MRPHKNKPSLLDFVGLIPGFSKFDKPCSYVFCFFIPNEPQQQLPTSVPTNSPKYPLPKSRKKVPWSAGESGLAESRDTCRKFRGEIDPIEFRIESDVQVENTQIIHLKPKPQEKRTNETLMY